MANSRQTSYALGTDLNSPYDTNILLIGETGVGKTTFINALINYLYHENLDVALNGDFKFLIPTSFVVSDPETYDDVIIPVGNVDPNEVIEVGKSSTQACRSYVFRIRDRILRFIDTPGIGDCRGPDQEKKNLQNMLNYISLFPHLNGICLLLKTSTTRLTIFLRYCVKELLRHLHVDCKNNMMFVFTGARSSFFRPGAAAPVIKVLVQELKKKNNVEIPFDSSNSFLFDNEAFRLLAIHKSGHRIFMEEKDQYAESWVKSVKDLTRLIARIKQCAVHNVRNTVSLNEALQQIQIISRPIAEASKLIHENLSLAKEYKEKLVQDPKSFSSQALTQKSGKFVKLPYKLTVCVNRTCTKFVSLNSLATVSYETVCHEDCYLEGVVQECIGHPFLKECAAMDGTDNCKHCGCHWKKHMHVTYRYESVSNDTFNKGAKSTVDPTMITKLLDERISALENENKQIRRICLELSNFIKANSLLPFNDDVIEYVRLYLDEEVKKPDRNKIIIQGLEEMIQEYEEQMKFFTKNDSRDDENEDLVQSMRSRGSEHVLELIKQLYKLPINGPEIEDQMKKITHGLIETEQKSETVIDLTNESVGSTALAQLR